MKTETFYFIEAEDRNGLVTRHNLNTNELYDVLVSEKDPYLKVERVDIPYEDHVIDQEIWKTPCGITFGKTTHKYKN